MNDERLTAAGFQACEGVEDWRVLAYGVNAWFAADTQSAGAGLVRRITELAGPSRPIDRLPDIDLRADGVHVRVVAPGGGYGLRTADVDTARAISGAARELGLTADPTRLQTMLLAIDALEPSRVLPFWQATLGYVRNAGNLDDPGRRQPTIWFQEMDEPRPLRDRFHLDIARPDQLGGQSSEGAAALAEVGAVKAGVYDVTYADPEGNEADLIPASPLPTADADPGDSDDPGDSGGTGEPGGTGDWQVMFGALVAYPTDSLEQAADLAEAVAAIADGAGFALLVDLRPGGVTIDTGKDLWEDPRFAAVAGRVQAAARELGLAADPRGAGLRFVQLGIAAVDVPAVRAFWGAALDYVYDPREGVTDIYDPRRLGPPFFVQQTSADERERLAQRNRVHVDLFVPDDQAKARIAAAVAAGGRIVNDTEAPDFVTIADPEGNVLDIAVAVGRVERAIAQGPSADSSSDAGSDAGSDSGAGPGAGTGPGAGSVSGEG